jgi:RNA-directed DNA polymerase
MNEFDQFVKHSLKVRHYVRYTDDFIIVSQDRNYLVRLLPSIQTFLKERLKLVLHPKKISIRKYGQGIDFLGYVALPRHRLLRTKTKRRIFRKLKVRVKQYRQEVIDRGILHQSLQSYLGVFSHANTFKLQKELKNQFWLTE